MRRFLGVLAFLVTGVFWAGCADVSEPVVPENLEQSGIPATGVSADIFDGSSGAEGANPHFYFLSPLVPSPDYDGVADDNLNPVVTVCPVDLVDETSGSCSGPTAVFSLDALDSENQLSVSPGVGYSAVWKTKTYPAPEGEMFRITVSVLDRDLGWLEAKSYDQQSYASFQYTDAEGYVAISANGSANIAFRIEDGALESEFCDADSVEDCDVEVFAYDEEGCLRVFNSPGTGTEALGSQACIPASAAKLNGQVFQEDFVVVMTLEEQNQFQGGATNSDWQIPYFPDVRTIPDGIDFDRNGEGVSVTICQTTDPDVLAGDLHQYLRPFLIFADGTTVLPEDYFFEVGGECETFGEHHAQTSAPGQDGGAGLLSRVAGSVSKASRFFLPKPLHARRRLHGGLNTVVWEFSRDEGDGGGGDDGEGGGDGPANVAGLGQISGLEPAGDGPVVLEMGALLDVDPSRTEVSILNPYGIVGSDVTVVLEVIDFGGGTFPFDVPVTVQAASGSETIPATVEYSEASQRYTATYTPAAVGTDVLTITVDGGQVFDENGDPYTIEIRPVAPSAEFSSYTISASEAGSPTTVTVTVLDLNEDPYLDGDRYDPVVELDVVVDLLSPESVPGTPVKAVDEDENGDYDGIYVASWTPGDYGDFSVVVTIGGDTIGTPETVTTAPWPVDASASSATVPRAGRVESVTDLTINLLNTNGTAYDYGDLRPVVVKVGISGANDFTLTAIDDNDDGVYEASYTPVYPGTDNLRITVEEVGVLPEALIGTYQSEVAPKSGDLTVVVDISGGAPADGLPVFLYPSGSSVPTVGYTDSPDLAANPDGVPVASVTFPDIDFGDYTVHLPKRDFDADFSTPTQTMAQAMTRAITHDQAPNSITFVATTLSMPETSRVWRVRSNGSGNAYQYIPGGRSWTSAQNQVRDNVLHGVQGHLATITNENGTAAQENGFVASFFATDPSLCPEDTSEKKCRVRGWLGMTDEAVERTFVWVTGEAADWFNWPDGYTLADQPFDRKGNLDHVEIGPNGVWNIINGASSNNDGYFVEWEVVWPQAPSF